MEQQKQTLQENKTRLWIYIAVGLGIFLILGAVVYFAFMRTTLIPEENQTEINSGEARESSETPLSNSTQNGEPISQNNVGNTSSTENYQNWTTEDYLS